jgi:hypothetical protein
MFAIIYQFFRILPVLITFCAFLFAIILKSKFLWFMTAGIIINGILWFIIGHITLKYYPELAKRPQTSHCYYIERNKQALSSGLPSGHCQTMAFVSTWIILYFIIYHIKLHISIPISMLLIFSTWFMMYTRAGYFKCHTWFQAIFGSIIGIIMALLLWIIF